MNDKAFERKVDRDIDRARKDIATLGDDGVTSLTRKFDRLTDDVKEPVSDAVKFLNEGVEQGLDQFNTKIQDVADRVPGNFSKKAARYPWVTVTMTLIFGLLLGALLKPGRQPVG